MAVTSGLVKTNVTYDSYFWVKWEQTDQSMADNTTTIKWSCGVYCGHNFYLNAIRMSAVIIDGTQVYGGGTYSNFGRLTNNTLASGTKVIHHADNGTKTLTIGAFTGWLYDNYNYSAAAKDYALTTIPRKATVTSAENFNSNGAPTIKFSNPGGFKLRPYLNFYDASGTRIYQIIRDLGEYSSPYKFSISSAEKTAILNAANKASSYAVTEGVSTYNGDTFMDSSSISKTFTIVENDSTKPTESIAVSPSGSLSSAFDGLYVQGKTKVSVVHAATFKYGATASKYSATVAGKTYSGQSVTTSFINTSGTLTVTGTVKDSRGFTASDSKTISVIPYTKPSVSPLSGLSEIVCSRCDDDGTISTSGTSLKVRCGRKYSKVMSEDTQKNFCLLRLRIKSNGGSYGSWVTLIAKSAASNNFDGVVPGVTVQGDSAYSVQIQAIDDIGEHHDIYFDIPTEIVPFHLGEGGLNVGVGRYANMESSKRVDVAWATHFEDEIYFKGTKLLDVIYPVGSVYMTVSSANPSTLFGGTWVQVQDSGISSASGIKVFKRTI